MIDYNKGLTLRFKLCDLIYRAISAEDAADIAKNWRR